MYILGSEDLYIFYLNLREGPWVTKRFLKTIWQNDIWASPPLPSSNILEVKGSKTRDIFLFPREEVRAQIFFSLLFSDSEETESHSPPKYGGISTEKVRAEPFLSSEVIGFFSLEMFQPKWNYHLSRIVYKEFFFNFIKN